MPGTVKAAASPIRWCNGEGWPGGGSAGSGRAAQTSASASPIAVRTNAITMMRSIQALTCAPSASIVYVGVRASGAAAGSRRAGARGAAGSPRLRGRRTRTGASASTIGPAARLGGRPGLRRMTVPRRACSSSRQSDPRRRVPSSASAAVRRASTRASDRRRLRSAAGDVHAAGGVADATGLGVPQVVRDQRADGGRGDGRGHETSLVGAAPASMAVCRSADHGRLITRHDRPPRSSERDPCCPRGGRRLW